MKQCGLFILSIFRNKNGPFDHFLISVTLKVDTNILQYCRGNVYLMLPSLTALS